MLNLPTLTTFILYFFFLLWVGIYFYRKTTSIDDYLLGGRNMGSWVTALSAQASDMSGWLLMGLPGAVYLSGVNQSWIAIGLWLGTLLNWILVAPRLRIYTSKTNSLTLSSFFEKRFQDPTGLLRIISALVTLIFFTIYASSGLVAAGKLFESMFNIDYKIAIVIGAFIIILYTFLGGFLAVCWTDLFQGALMFIAIILVPTSAYFFVGGSANIAAAIDLNNISMSLFSNGNKPISFLAIISTAAWGLGYFGQPHILARFMSIKSVKELPSSTWIAMIWVTISLAGAVVIGLIAIPMFPGLSGGEQEKVFIYMIEKLFNPWIGGIFLAAILAAIMSTIDSQLLVSSSVLTEDFYKHIIKKDASDLQQIWIGRACVLIISVISIILALIPGNTVLGLVSYAWAGFGAAFGPLVLAALFSKKTSWQSALAGMITGTLTTILWKNLGLGTWLYELAPGFIFNFAMMWFFNRKFKSDCSDELAEVAKESRVK